MLVQLLLREGPLAAQQILEKIGLSHRETLYQNYLRPALRAGLIERTIPEKPRSSKQRYRLAKKGEALAESTKDTTTKPKTRARRKMEE